MSTFMGCVSIWHLYNQVDHLMNSVMIETLDVRKVIKIQVSETSVAPFELCEDISVIQNLL